MKFCVSIDGFLSVAGHRNQRRFRRGVQMQAVGVTLDELRTRFADQLNLADDAGITPLHVLAAHIPGVAQLDVLLKAGANLTAVDLVGCVCHCTVVACALFSCVSADSASSRLSCG